MTDDTTRSDRGVWRRIREASSRLHFHLHRNPITGLVTKVVVTVFGVLVIGAGLVMMVTPGPGLVAILVGLGILATEWHWAERWMRTMKDKAREAADKARDLDPAVRRRRILLTLLGVVLVAVAVAGYVTTFGWPQVLVDVWDWVQGLNDAVPELPGM